MATLSVAPPKPAKPGQASPRLTSSEEFLNWLQPGVHADLIGGEIHMHSPVSIRHAQMVNFMDHLLRSHLDQSQAGVLFRETVAFRLSVRETFLPDLAFVTRAQMERVAATHVPFAPTFALECLSPATQHLDTGRKLAAYELHGVQEYWILDPERLAHRFFRRAGDMLEEYASGMDEIELTSVPGFWVRRAWLNPENLPKVSDALKEMVSARRPRRVQS